MDEELSKLTHEFYDELGRVSDDKSYQKWLKDNEFALIKMIVDNLDEIRQEVRIL